MLFHDSLGVKTQYKNAYDDKGPAAHSSGNTRGMFQVQTLGILTASETDKHITHITSTYN